MTNDSELFSSPDSKALIAAFFQALNIPNLAECQQHLQALQTLAQTEPELETWALYLRGVLVFESTQDWAQAELCFLRATQLSPQGELFHRLRYALAATYNAQGRWDEASTLLQQAVVNAQRANQPQEEAKAKKLLAICIQRAFVQGDMESGAMQLAVEYCQSALNLLAPLLALTPTDELLWLEGSVWNTLGSLYMVQSQLAEAEACYQRDLTVAQKLNDRRGMGISYLNLGEIAQKLGAQHWSEALHFYQIALEAFQAANERPLLADTLANLGTLYVALQQHTTALECFGEALAIIEAVRSNNTSVTARTGFGATVSDIYAHTLLLHIQLEQFEPAFNLTEQARARGLLDLLESSSVEVQSNQQAQPLTLSEVQRRLPANALLLSYFTTGVETVRLGKKARQQQLHRHRFPPDRTLLFIIDQQTIQGIDLDFSPSQLVSSTPDQHLSSDLLQPALLHKLYEKLVAPVASLLNRKQYLYLLPHGPYHRLPFRALLDRDNSTLQHNGRAFIIYGASASSLLRSMPIFRPPEYTCLTFGFNDTGEKHLHFAEAEAKRVAQLAGGHAHVGENGQKATLYSQSPHYRWLHISCHGQFDPTSPLDSFLQLGTNETLTAREILQNLKLRCELVTLSACESGRSQVQRGDELHGLISAFLQVGTQNVLATLWRVNELATLVLMDKFYQEVTQGVEFAQALAHAQHTLRTQTRQDVLGLLRHLHHIDLLTDGLFFTNSFWEDELISALGDHELPFADPYYWAAFVLFRAGS